MLLALALRRSIFRTGEFPPSPDDAILEAVRFYIPSPNFFKRELGERLPVGISTSEH